MSFTASLKYLSHLITLCLCQIYGKKLKDHSDQNNDDNTCDQLPDCYIIPCIRHAERDRQKNDHRCNICHQSENTEHHIADCISNFTYHTEITKKKDDRKRKKHDQ